MTPTLLGRWQIRIFLLATVGLIISLIVGLFVGFRVPLFALLYVLFLGLVWDVIYQFITSYRWDRDWPTSYQVAAGIIEGALVWVLIAMNLPGFSNPPSGHLFFIFLIQYGTIWLSIFVLTQGPLRIFWLKWRYQGGQWFVSRNAQAGAATYQQQFAPPSPVVYGLQPQTASVPPPLSEYHFQQQSLPQPPVVWEYHPQQPAAATHNIVRTSNPDIRQLPAQQAGLPSTQPYACVCGLTFDRGNFCPRCGRPKM